VIPAFGLEAVLGVLGLYAALGVCACFVRLERRGRPEVAVGIVVGALLAQTLFYASEHGVPAGLLRPGPLRLGELLLVAAVAARIWTRWTPVTVSTSGLAWSAFLVWYATTAVVGIEAGNANPDVMYHAKLVLHLGGGYLLASGVPVRRLVDPRSLRWWLVGFAAMAVVQGVLTLSGGGTLFPGGPKELGADGASMHLALGILFLALEATRRRPRLWVVGAMTVTLAAPLFVSQRATVVHFAASAVALGLALSGGRVRDRFTVKPVQLGLLLLALVVLGLAAWLPGLREGESTPAVFIEAVDDTFGGVGNQQSADARVLKWDEAREAYEEHPIIGSGLGAAFTSFRPGIDGVGVYARSNVFDNSYLDLLVRTGLLGVALFLIAMILSLRDAWLVWTRHPDPVVAILGLAVFAFFAGMLAKGVVESVLDKAVLSTLFGIAAGVVASARQGPGTTPSFRPTYVSTGEGTRTEWS
jgi:O-antigen ligase